ncbi:hypothetical protein NQ314_011172 [Rhamnusium bicolor]|uniref:Uncharacterized protein n=1 Tax=Rhamnusium bicolor TaxID=1586634 RepID=A0AAV8XLG8_9CUCU|nr:hypothetical protein NQ314_011172 [Rhamnusium bicolor]
MPDKRSLGPPPKYHEAIKMPKSTNYEQVAQIHSTTRRSSDSMGNEVPPTYEDAIQASSSIECKKIICAWVKKSSVMSCNKYYQNT